MIPDDWKEIDRWIDREGKCIGCDASIAVWIVVYKDAQGEKHTRRERDACDCS